MESIPGEISEWQTDFFILKPKEQQRYILSQEPKSREVLLRGLLYEKILTWKKEPNS